MEQIICKHCGSVNDYHIVKAGPHDKAICNSCGNYIKFIKQEHSPFGDTSLMPFGKHKEKALINVPADYLLWLNDQPKCHPQIKEYILNNLAVLRQQIHEAK